MVVDDPDALAIGMQSIGPEQVRMFLPYTQFVLCLFRDVHYFPFELVTGFPDVLPMIFPFVADHVG